MPPLPPPFEENSDEKPEEAPDVGPPPKENPLRKRKGRDLHSISLSHTHKKIYISQSSTSSRGLGLFAPFVVRPSHQERYIETEKTEGEREREKGEGWAHHLLHIPTWQYNPMLRVSLFPRLSLADPHFMIPRFKQVKVRALLHSPQTTAASGPYLHYSHRNETFSLNGLLS